MDDSNFTIITDLKKFLITTKSIKFQRTNSKDCYRWIQQTLIKFDYLSLGKLDKGVVKQYIAHMSQYSRAQITRLVAFTPIPVKLKALLTIDTTLPESITRMTYACWLKPMKFMVSPMAMPLNAA